MNHRNLNGARQNRSRGFSTIELLLVMVVSLVIAALAIPKFDQVRRSLRIQGDARDLNGALNQAKLQAAAEFTRSRVYIDVGANIPNTFHVDVWDKTNNCWRVLGDAVNPCLVRGNGGSPVESLAAQVTFGLAGIGNAPPNTQTIAVQEGPQPCEHTRGNGLGTIPGTYCIYFNSRGVPIAWPTPIGATPAGAPTGNNAFYITDNSQVYGVTLGITGLSQVWATSASGPAAGNWYHK